VSRALYAGTAVAVVRGMKFAKKHGLALAAGRLLGSMELPYELDAAVPIPLHWRRRFSRGYDQVELMLSQASREWGLPVERLLTRVRHTSPQSRRGGAERRKALDGAFRASPMARGAKLLLVDDVVSSGATAEAAARALLDAGAEAVYLATFARSPLRLSPAREGPAEGGEKRRASDGQAVGQKPVVEGGDEVRGKG